MSVYLDNAATSFPKPPEVVEAVARYMSGCGANIGRGGYASAYAAAEIAFDVRSRLTALFGGPDPKCAVFTRCATESLNLIVRGLLRPGDHVIVSSVEHNAVMRPLTQARKAGITFSRIPGDADGLPDLSALPSLLRPETKAVIMTHASNVTGAVLPAEAVGAFCAENGLIFALDAAQTAGLIPIDMRAMHIGLLAVTGHKALYGPQGTGALLMRPELAARMEPLIVGGTGSFSHTEETPEVLPDRFEAGTLNLPGIAGLQAALRFVESRGVASLHAHETALADAFLAGLAPLRDRVRPVGVNGAAPRVGVVSVITPGADPALTAGALDERFGVMTRVGLHCAPAAHRALGTYPTGTLRFSFGAFNTEEDVSAALAALKEVLF